MTSTAILNIDRRDDGVALITLNRPESRNALSAALRDDIINGLRQLADDTSVGAAVLTGSGDVFCAGFDLKELAAGDADKVFANSDTYHRTVHTFGKPLIAAVNGPALAGGMDLALMCDIRLGCSTSRFGQPQVRMGIPAAYDLVRSVTDESTARYLCLTGDILDAESALNRDILSALYADRETLQSKALEMAATIAGTQSGDAMKARFIEVQPSLFG